MIIANPTVTFDGEHLVMSDMYAFQARVYATAATSGLGRTICQESRNLPHLPNPTIGRSIYHAPSYLP